MDTQDTPLVIFTILAQLSVGAFVVNGVLHVLAGRKNGQAKIDKLSDPALYAIGPIMVVALADQPGSPRRPVACASTPARTSGAAG